MSQDPGLASWLQLSLTPGLGSATLRKLLQQFGLPQTVLARKRSELAALAREHGLRKSELLKKLAEGGGTEPGSERELQPAREPRVLAHRSFFLRRLYHIERSDRLRGLHDQCVGYPVENAKHKRKPGALVG